MNAIELIKLMIENMVPQVESRGHDVAVHGQPEVNLLGDVHQKFTIRKDEKLVTYCVTISEVDSE